MYLPHLPLYPLLLIAFAWYVLAIPRAYADILAGKVTQVNSGDILVVKDESRRQHVVRLAGIDAPEDQQPFGSTSRHSLETLVAGKTITVEWEKMDAKRRLIGKVLIDGKDMNLEQLKRGMAWHAKPRGDEIRLQDNAKYDEAEDSAHQAAIGLWQDPQAIPPWHWRAVSKGIHQ